MIHLLISVLLALSEASPSMVAESNIPEDARLNFTELSIKYGRDCEEFNVVTEDGYILKVFHMKGNEGKKPVLLMHGNLDSADSFVLRGNISIAINLADAGYDVWAGNSRGNQYSKSNVNFSPVTDKQRFWDFSFHELGIYDLPATIDFILEKTGKSNLAAVGHSQGTTMFFVMSSMKPEYNKKVSVFIALAPVAYFSHVKPGLFVLLGLTPIFNDFLKAAGIEHIQQENTVMRNLTRFICSQGLVGYNLCENGIMNSRVVGDITNVEPEFFQIILGHFPIGTSRRSIIHFAQNGKNGRFAQYDYGESKNLKMYNSTTPPAYNLTNADMPMVLVVAKNDAMSGIKDVQRLKSELPNVVEYHEMKDDKWDHGDYVWARTIDVHVTPLLRQLLEKYAK